MLEAKLAPAQDKSSRRVMIVLHGLGDSVAGYYWLPSALNLPWLNYVLVNAPDPYFNGFAWYDFSGDASTGVRRSRTLLFELLDDLSKRGFPPEQTVLFGFSQGCLMTLDAGLRYPHQLAGLIGISGYVHEPEQLIRELSPVAREQRVLVTHGRLDPLIPLEESRAQMEQLKAAGIHLDWHEFDKAHTIAGEEEIALIREFVVGSF